MIFEEEDDTRSFYEGSCGDFEDESFHLGEKGKGLI